MHAVAAAGQLAQRRHCRTTGSLGAAGRTDQTAEILVDFTRSAGGTCTCADERRTTGCSLAVEDIGNVSRRRAGQVA